MKKFVFKFEPCGKDFFIKADSIKEAKKLIKKNLGGSPFYIGETNYKTTLIKAEVCR